ncbi:hypothetical protein [Dactylosporangium roseum]|uniref:hypothetical protein n=1 Tax=Dactylosporangium roseum TaxID=47989 RepID=UPI0031D50A55
MFTEYVAGRGMTSIARGLTNDGIACPSAYDRKRRPGRYRTKRGLTTSETSAKGIDQPGSGRFRMG